MALKWYLSPSLVTVTLLDSIVKFFIASEFMLMLCPGPNMRPMCRITDKPAKSYTIITNKKLNHHGTNRSCELVLEKHLRCFDVINTVACNVSDTHQCHQGGWHLSHVVRRARAHMYRNELIDVGPHASHLRHQRPARIWLLMQR